jgi:hypothetical protein
MRDGKEVVRDFCRSVEFGTGLAVKSLTAADGDPEGKRDPSRRAFATIWRNYMA